jgi:hypothetical protein
MDKKLVAPGSYIEDETKCSVMKQVTKETRLRWRNFPMFLLRGLIEVAQMGEEKYGTYDFLKKDYTVNDHLDALKRHLMKFEDPLDSDFDHESKQLHLYHVAWRALVAAFVREQKSHLDDRFRVKVYDKPLDKPE